MQASPSNGRSTHFEFGHPVFKFKNARFLLATDATPSLALPLGDLEVLVPLDSLRNEFELDDTDDGELLRQVVSSLRFVKMIRPGDSIPREILDGTASWKIEDRHYDLASARLKRSMIAEPSASDFDPFDGSALENFGTDKPTHALIVAAVSQLAIRLGLGSATHEIGRRLDFIARELAYIEALRERWLVLQATRSKVGQLGRLYKNDRTLSAEFLQVDRLVRRPLEELQNIIEELDAHLGDIYGVLGNIPTYIKFIREARDELHTRMMLWDEFVLLWDATEIARGTENEQLLRRFYRFLAVNFSTAQPWQLTGGGARR